MTLRLNHFLSSFKSKTKILEKAQALKGVWAIQVWIFGFYGVKLSSGSGERSGLEVSTMSHLIMELLTL